VQHTPDEQGWEQLLTGAVGVLRAAEEPLQNPAVAGVDTAFARQEFISGGQQVGVREVGARSQQVVGCGVCGWNLTDRDVSGTDGTVRVTPGCRA
jgi:hypothetical protein